ncbi:MAG: hypothetical protein LBF12_06955 [Christensenellaceae bacterium]|jgi:pimeloyl-ACP methyl ester carboxylesterase|nr:hypothetical protein [Christensenellaceae bacterium]
MKLKRAVIALFVVVCMLVFMFTAFACNKDKTPEKSAIIVIPGLQGSILYDPVTNTPAWSAEDFTEVSLLMDALEYGYLKFNDDGLPDNEVSERLVTPDFYSASAKWKYGVNLEEVAKVKAFGLTPTVVKGLTLAIEEKYQGTEQEVLVYQYDWRRSNVEEAEKLENFIEGHGFTDVKFVVHSMGGILVSQYLARSQANIEKCSLFVSISTPFYGSSEITKYMETKKLPGSFIHLKVGVDFPSAFELIPFAKFNNTAHFEEGATSLMVDGEYLSYSDAIAHFGENTEWGQNSLGEPKSMFSRLDDYYSSMFLSDGRHITQLVNSYYIQGNGRETTVTVSYKDGVYYPDGNITQNLGDGIVPLYSGICGLSVDAENVILIEEDSTLPDKEGYVGHMALPSQPRTIAEVLKLLESVE